MVRFELSEASHWLVALKGIAQPQNNIPLLWKNLRALCACVRACACVCVYLCTKRWENLGVGVLQKKYTLGAKEVKILSIFLPRD